MQIDRFLPTFHFNEVHSIEIDAEPERIYRAIKDVRAGDIPLFRELMGLRSLPGWLMRRRKHSDAVRSDKRTLLEDVLGNGTFVTLADDPEREFVVGSIGKFWQVSGSMLRLSGPDDYLARSHDDNAKTAMNFRIYRSRRTNG